MVQTSTCLLYVLEDWSLLSIVCAKVANLSPACIKRIPLLGSAYSKVQSHSRGTLDQCQRCWEQLALFPCRHQSPMSLDSAEFPECAPMSQSLIRNECYSWIKREGDYQFRSKIPPAHHPFLQNIWSWKGPLQIS